MDISAVVRLAVTKGASDLHLIASNPPLLRINGTLHPVTEMQPLTTDDINEAFNQITSDEEKANFQRSWELDFSYTFSEGSRIRCNAAKQRGTINLTIRLVPSVIPTLDELGLPEVCKDLVLKSQGLVIVSGPTGSGKSTTLSAMINYLNGIESRRVVTVEDPIEYLYSNDMCTITQRELGSDTLSFAKALKHVLRQDPNVILIGELRDSETVSAALTIAETGHLVLTTSHSASAPQAVERIIDLFPPHERPMAQARLASLILGILCQRLIPKVDSSGRIVAVEIMLASSAVRNTIREGKIYQLANTMLTQAQSGMVMLDQALVDLYCKEIISCENLFAFCNNQNEVAKLIGNIEQVNPSLTLTF